MVYKKYIKRNGKIFGPYYYSSHREGNKVKTTYLNVKEKYQNEVKKRRIFAVAAAFLVIIALFFFLKPGLTSFIGLTTKEPLFILDPIQSHPIVGGSWIVKLNTEGTADLTIRAVKGTTWSNENDNNNKDIRFLEIRCGDDILDYKWIDNSVFIAGYSCDETAYHTVKVFDKGTHILEFKFGNNIKYAYNFVGCCSSNITSMVHAVNISIKYPNGSFYLQDVAMTHSSTEADTATWHNTTWTYDYTRGCGQEGNYTAKADVWEVQNATLNDTTDGDIRVNITNTSGWVLIYSVIWDSSAENCSATCASQNGSWTDPTPGWGTTDGDSAGGDWSGVCCGDDPGEYYNTSEYDDSLDISDDDTDACCNAAGDCVHAGGCNATGTHDVNVGDDAADDYCLDGMWYDCYDDDDCNATFTCNQTSHDCVDIVNPTISVTYPTNNSYLTPIWINITGNATDENNDTVIINDTRFGSNVGSYGSWNFTNTTIAEGVYNVLITANDSSNNTNSTIIVFTIDRTYPQIEYGENTLANATWYSQDWVFVNVSINETNIDTVTFEWNGANDTFDDDYYENQTDLVDGNYTFKVYVNDSVGYENSTALRIVYLDDTIPLINATFPANNSYLSQTWINITGTASDTYGNTVYINDTRFGENTGTYGSWNFTNTTIAEGNYSVLITANDSANNTNSTLIVFTIDRTYPQIEYGENTLANATWYSQDWVFVNVSINETNIDTVTFEWNGANDTFDDNYYENQTGLVDGNYTFKVYVNDSAGHENSTVIREVYLDDTIPLISATFPANNSYLDQTWINITGTASDTNYGTVVINDTRFGTNTGTYQSWNFTNTSIADGIYSVLITANDSAGNSNLTIIVFTIDTTDPNIAITYPTNNSYLSQTWINITGTASDTNTDTIYVNDTRFGTNTETYGSWNFTNTTIADGTYNVLITANDSASNTNSTIIVFTIDTIEPNIANVTIAPSTNASIDPDVTMNITVKVTDTNLDTVILQYWNYNTSVETCTNVTMEFDASGNGHYNGSFFPNEFNGTWYYQIWANDSAGNDNTSAPYEITVQYECTWDVSTTKAQSPNWGTIPGLLNSESNIGNLTINNTGDSAYHTNNCTLHFYLKNTGAGTISFSDRIPDLNAEEKVNIAITATFLNETKEEDFIINITELDVITTPSSLTSNGTLGSYAGGPYLIVVIDTYESSVNLTNLTSFSLGAYVQNTGNETATDVSLNWNLPTAWSNVSGSINLTVPSLNCSDPTLSGQCSDNVSKNTLRNDISATINPDPTANAGEGIQTIYANATCTENVSGNKSGDSKTITVNCYAGAEDEHCPTPCTFVTTAPNYDVDCIRPTVTTETPSTGGGGAGAPPMIVSEATYELIRGKDTSFSLEIKNPFKEASLRDVKIKVTGYLAKYITIEPATLDEVPANSSLNFTIQITAPAYFTVGVHNLTFTIKSQKEIKTTRTPRTEKRYVTLIIRELGREDAAQLISLSENYIKEMQALELNTEEVESLLQQSKNALERKDYEEVEELSEKIESIATAALESYDKIVELEKKIEDAENRGIKMDRTRRMLGLAKAASDRGDYDLALERAEDAEITYALETKGEFNLFYFIAQNTLQVFFGMLIALALLTILFFRVKLSAINHSLTGLREEEDILLGLMKTTQHECFVEKRLSMHEYYQTILQYEDKLSKAVQRIVELESTKANLFKFKRARLELERKRLLDLMKETQNQYIKEKTIETRVYTNRMHSYSTRLSEIEEELAMQEAGRALRRDKLHRFLQVVAFVKTLRIVKRKRTKRIEEKRKKKALIEKLGKEKERLRREELLKKLKLRKAEELRKKAAVEKATRTKLEKRFLIIAAREEERQKRLAGKRKKEKLKQIRLQEKLRLKALKEKRKQEKLAQIKKERIERHFLAIAAREEKRKKEHAKKRELKRKKKKTGFRIGDMLKGLEPKITKEKLEKRFLAIAEKLERKAKKKK